MLIISLGKALTMGDLEFKEYETDGDEGASTVRAAVVDEDNTEVNTRTGAQFVGEGSVVVETDRPGVYDVIDKDAWASTGYASGNTETTDETEALSDRTNLDNDSRGVDTLGLTEDDDKTPEGAHDETHGDTFDDSDNSSDDSSDNSSDDSSDSPSSDSAWDSGDSSPSWSSKSTE